MKDYSSRLRLTMAWVAVCAITLTSCIVVIPGTDDCDDIEQCCDPTTNPRLDDNSVCVEGARCCANGQWSCNAADTSTTCEAPGCECEAVDACCDPATKPAGDFACDEGAHCCADGQWMCDIGDGTSPCAAPGTECEVEVCGGIVGIACTDPNDYCWVNEGECCCDIQGVCTPRPDACIELFDPVCGCDAKTYSNSCFAAMAGISVDHTGACP